MTAPTSDERREVAERLRDNIHEYGTEYIFFLYALGMSQKYHGPCDWTKVHELLADLVDPTCHVDTAYDWYGRPLGSTCSVCHAPLYRGMRYCPSCGSRVVDDVDRDGE